MTREEAIQILSTRDAHGVLCGYTSGVTEALDMAIEALQTDFVRCKDCKYGETSEVNKYYIECTLNEVPTFVDGFCSYGKRKTPTIQTFTESAEAYKAWTGEEMCKTHGRLIDADKLKKQLDTVYNEMANEKERKGLRLARWFLISAPTVSADRPHGEWQRFDDEYGYWIGCSNCKEYIPKDKYGNDMYTDYCPNCGALMLIGGDTK